MADNPTLMSTQGHSVLLKLETLVKNDVAVSPKPTIDQGCAWAHTSEVEYEKASIL